MRFLSASRPVIDLTGMPFLPALSTANDTCLLTPLQQRLAEINIVMDVIRLLRITESLKKRMLGHAIWEVAFATGNTQRAFRDAGPGVTRRFAGP